MKAGVSFVGVLLASAGWAQSSGVSEELPSSPSVAVEAGGEAGSLVGRDQSYLGTNLRLTLVGRSPFSRNNGDGSEGWVRWRYDFGLDWRNGWIHLDEEERFAGRAKGVAGFTRFYYEGATTTGGLRAGMFMEARLGMMRIPAVSGSPDLRVLSSPPKKVRTVVPNTSALTTEMRFGAEVGGEALFGSIGLGGGAWFAQNSNHLGNISIFMALGYRR